MVWDSTLEAAATSWAQGLANSGCNLQHGGMPSNTGQNLYASYVSQPPGVTGGCQGLPGVCLQARACVLLLQPSNVLPMLL